MLKTIVFTAAITVAAALMPAGAGAMPLAQQKTRVAATDTVLLVREGCGRGFQWSERRRRCVPDSPGAQMRDMMRETFDRCGPGRRWSERRGRCVRD